MSETYVALGLSTPWSVALFGVVVSLLPIPWRKKDGRKWRPTPMMVLNAGFWAIAGIFGLPMEWFILAMPLLAGIGFLLPSAQWQGKTSARIGAALSMVIIGMLLFIGYRSAIPVDWLVLREDSVSWNGAVDQGTVPRQGLRVHATGSDRGWWETRNWYSWTTYSGENLGPHINGSMLYNGPTGFVTGDELGKRVAKWAGSEPAHRIVSR